MTREIKEKLTKLKFDVFEWFNKAIPIAMVALLAWVLLTVTGTQKEILLIRADIVSTQLKITEVETHLQEHRAATMADRALAKEDRTENAIIHHIDNKVKCNSCHGKR